MYGFSRLALQMPHHDHHEQLKLHISQLVSCHHSAQDELDTDVFH